MTRSRLTELQATAAAAARLSGAVARCLVGGRSLRAANVARAHSRAGGRLRLAVELAVLPRRVRELYEESSEQAFAAAGRWLAVHLCEEKMRRLGAVRR